MNANDNIDKLRSGGEDDENGDGVGNNSIGHGKGGGATTNASGESGFTSSNGNRIGNGKSCDAGSYDCESCENKHNKKESGCCDAVEEQLEHLGKGTTWLAIILGQILSALLCVSAFATVQLVETYNIRIPNAQNFAFYMVLATVFTTILACRPAERNLFPILRTRGWKYAFVALADAEAKYLITKAFQLTTLTSVQLLDCFAIPTVLSMSWLVLRIRFKVPHILGVSICLLGVSCLVWADIEDGRPIGPVKDRFLGDMLCLGGAFLLGVSSIAQEFVVKTFDSVEFLGMIGLFGSFVSGAQTVLLEYGAVTEMDWSVSPRTPTFLLITYASAQLAFYVLATAVIKYSGATFFHLSLLSADFYSLVVSMYFLRVKFHALYFLSYVLVMTGVITFSIKPTLIASHVYKSLTREHTTTLDLELMASTPSSTGYPAIGSHHHKNHNNTGTRTSNTSNRDHEEVCLGGPGSLLVTEKSHLLNAKNHHSSCNSSSPMLSNESCDVVLQTTATLGRGRKPIQSYKGSNGATSMIPEEETC